jgi:uncharacterized protein
MTLLTVQVKPNARVQKISQLDDGTWVIHLKSAPTEGKANQELVALIAQRFGVPKAQVKLKSGQTSRFKRVEIED